MLKNKVRIIAGKLKRQQIHFPDTPGLRPTTDRVRETLFNWLAPHIYQARCLDCFAGSGVLGFEAISRGAEHVTFSDNSKINIATICENAERLKVTNFDTVCCEQPNGLSQLKGRFNLVFLDPPYDSLLIPSVLTKLVELNLLENNALIYTEESQDKKSVIPNQFGLLKESNTKNIHYSLFVYTK